MSTETSPTKAAQFCQYLSTERDFSAAYLNAVLANDNKAVADALDIIDLSFDDVALTKDEVLAFLRGQTLSGEFEITSWDGYYVTNPLPSNETFALLISSRDNRVFWGPVDGFFLKNWSNCEVKYQVGSNTSLSFSSPAGDATLSFSRDVDDLDGSTGESTFKGTFKGIPISGTRTTPPLPNVNNASFSDASFSNDPDDPTPTPSSDFISTAITVYNFMKYFGGPAAAVAVIFWICRQCYPWCPSGVRRLTTTVADLTTSALVWKKRRLMNNNIRFDLGLDDLKRTVMQKLNEAILYADYDKETWDEIIQEFELKKVANEALSAAIKEYAEGRLKEDGEREMNDMWKDVEKDAGLMLTEEEGQMAQDRTNAVMEHFGQQSDGIKALVDLAVLEGRKEWFNNHAESCATDRKNALKAANDAKASKQKLGKQLDEVKKEIEQLEAEHKEKEAEEKREEQKELEAEIANQEKVMEDKSKEASDDKDKMDDAVKQRDEYEEEREQADKDSDSLMREYIK